MSTTTDETEIIKRDINELLSLDTYQDMTDEEIQSIIDYKQKIAYESALSGAQIAAMTETCEKLAKQNEKNFEILHNLAMMAVSHMPTMAVIPSE